MYSHIWFEYVQSKPYYIICATLLVAMILSSALLTLYKDTSPDAYIEPENPALLYRDKVKEIFGLDDPFVIAIEAPPGQTIYQPDDLRLVVELTDIMMNADNIDPDRVASLTTESIAEGREGELLISPAFESPPDADEIADIRKRIENYSPFMGKLVARDGSMTMVVGEMIDQDLSSETFQYLMEEVDALRENYRGTLHLAGEASSAGYLDQYISEDVGRQLPFVLLLILIVLAVSFRSTAGVLLPFIVAAFAAIIAMSLRALMDIPYYAITNGLIVVIISISVADAIHILTEYKVQLHSGTHKTPTSALMASMTEIFHPITLTTFTTIGGFVGIWYGTDMPPMKAFGMSASIGVFVAWVFSISFLPACLFVLHKGKDPAKVWKGKNHKGRDLEGKLLGLMSRFVVRHAGPVLFVSGAVLIGSIWLATLVTTDYSRIENFAESESIRIADTRINEALDGTYRLLVVVDALEPDGLLNPEVLNKIEALQNYALTLPHVNGTSSIVDILKEVNKGTAGGDPAHYIIPDDPDSIAQLFFVYEALGNPADLEDDIDFDRQLALVELRTDAASFSQSRPLVEELERFLAEEFNSDIAIGSLSGRLYLNYHWLNSIEANHLLSIIVAVSAALIMAAITFRSIVAALYCLYHVVFAVFMVYAFMGFFGIPLSITTAMFAAITIGLGIDFSIHSVERAQTLATEAGAVTAETIHESFQSTGRALLYNLFALCLGFSALLVSNNPTIIDFAALLIVAVAANFLASMTALPAFMYLTKPKFLIRTARDTDGGAPRNLKAAATAGLVVVALAAGLILSLTSLSQAQEISAEEIVQNMSQRPDGASLTRDIKMTLTDRRGNSRERLAKASRINTETEKRSLIAFTYPSNIKGTAFLSFDYFEEGAETDQWLYLPAMRRTRRIAGANRGKYFLGTDFTFDDIQVEASISPEDYSFTMASAEESSTEGHVTLNGLPRSPEISKELGYSRVLVDIDPQNWMPIRMRLFNAKGVHFKTVSFENIIKVDEIWTQEIIRATNHKTGHETTFEFSNINFAAEIDPSDLEQRKLERSGR